MMSKKKLSEEKVEELVKEARDSWLKQEKIKKSRVKSFSELPNTDEWVEAEFTKPIKVRNVFKKKVAV